MKPELNFARRVINLPGACAPYLSSATADALRVLLAVGAEPNADASALARLVGLPEDRVVTALLFWKESGILVLEGEGETICTEAPREEGFRPAYTGADLERIASESEVGELVDVCSAILGKTFTPTETETLFYLYDGLRLDFEYVVRLCKFCYDLGKPSLRYIEKVGMSLYDRGIVTVPALAVYIENEEKKHETEYRIRRLFGLGERALTPKEQEYLGIWTVDWNMPYALLELGYNEMIAAIGQVKFSYLNGILKKWQEAGVRTKEEAEALSVKHKETKKTAKTEQKEIGFDLDEFFKAATMRGEGSQDEETR